MQKKTDRRTFLAAAGATATTVALAGCSSGGDSNGDNGDNGGDGGDGGDGSGGGGPSVPDAADSYLQDNSANGYSGSGDAVDETGSSAVTIDVGAGDNGFAFDPAAVFVSPGTEVEWAWTGEGGAHNVVSADSSDNEFDSGDTVDSSSETFSQTFDGASNNMYYCTPHQGAGMHGAVIVVDE